MLCIRSVMKHELVRKIFLSLWPFCQKYETVYQLEFISLTSRNNPWSLKIQAFCGVVMIQVSYCGINKQESSHFGGVMLIMVVFSCKIFAREHQKLCKIDIIETYVIEMGNSLIFNPLKQWVKGKPLHIDQACVIIVELIISENEKNRAHISI